MQLLHLYVRMFVFLHNAYTVYSVMCIEFEIIIHTYVFTMVTCHVQLLSLIDNNDNIGNGDSNTINNGNDNFGNNTDNNNIDRNNTDTNNNGGNCTDNSDDELSGKYVHTYVCMLIVIVICKHVCTYICMHALGVCNVVVLWMMHQ